MFLDITSPKVQEIPGIPCGKSSRLFLHGLGETEGLNTPVCGFSRQVNSLVLCMHR